jgi:hypothetical protein
MLVSFAFVRFAVSLNHGGSSSGDLAAATFDIQGNFVRQ